MNMLHILKYVDKQADMMRENMKDIKKKLKWNL